MSAFISFVAVAALAVLAWLAVAAAGLSYLFGVVIPYAALGIFMVGLSARILGWARSPVPFRIPTTAGQQKSLPWIKHSKVENPSGTGGVFIRMLLEVLLFRSLFRNLKTELRDGPRLTYGSAKWLWAAGLAFHWTFLIIAIRHGRFFFQNVPQVIQTMESLDSFLQIGAPLLYITDVVFLGAVTYLFIRRVAVPQVKYISLAADYFPLFLILGIGVTGVMMRYLIKPSVVHVKTLMMSLVTFSPVVPEGLSPLFYVHLFLVSALFLYFPFSKLVHAGGVFLSPTRNLSNNSRVKRHINPWNAPVHLHTYEEYEDEFREKMKTAGIPVEKE